MPEECKHFPTLITKFGHGAQCLKYCDTTPDFLLCP